MADVHNAVKSKIVAPQRDFRPAFAVRTKNVILWPLKLWANLMQVKDNSMHLNWVASVEGRHLPDNWLNYY